MRDLKRAADPEGLLNPGKMFDAPPMDENLRYGTSYRAHAWVPALDFAPNGGLAMAIEQCNGQGVCRKDGGLMCPSFQATRDEMHSTRGRANLLRALITSSTAAASDRLSEQAAFEALDLCLACKGCKAECPSGVDMAKLKFEFLAKYYDHRPRPLRDYVFGYFHITARLLAAFAPLVNVCSRIPLFRHLAARILNIAPDRPFPTFATMRARVAPQPGLPRVLFLRDAFTHYVEPHVEQAAFDLLAAAGFDVFPLSTMTASAALLSKGFIPAARSQARILLLEIHRLDTRGDAPIVGLEPSEVYAFRHENTELLPDQSGEITSHASRTWLLDEFLLRSGFPERLRIGIKSTKLLFHPHCHQRAEESAVRSSPSGAAATMEMLRQFGYDVQLSAAGCCGMAGTFGYEAEHYELSQAIGSQRLFPQVRGEGHPVAATGAACRMQIAQATGADVQHPLVWVRRSMQEAETNSKT
jgi:Fe-S oxidoreductase